MKLVTERGKLRHAKMLQLSPPITISLLSLTFLFSTLLVCQIDGAAVVSSKPSSVDSPRSSRKFPELHGSYNQPIKIKLLAPSKVPKKYTRTRQNSRFLRTFPSPMQLTKMATRQKFPHNKIHNSNNNHNYFSSSSSSSTSYKRNFFGNKWMHPNYPQGFMSPPMRPHPLTSSRARIEAENSPIFYIKLPPVPYVFMPGVGYVSPHPYTSSSSMPLPMSAASALMSPDMASSFSAQENEIDPAASVISLPLKFLSNGRPHQIESPKRKKGPGPGIKDTSSENKGASLISGGKYSFNGRPTAVFVVRSPASQN